MVETKSKEGAQSKEEEVILDLFRGLTKSDRARARALLDALASTQLKKVTTG